MSAPYDYSSIPAIPVAYPVPEQNQQQNQEEEPRYQSMGRPAIDSVQLSRLKEQGYTRGLLKALELNKESFPLRIWIIDNSSSMLQDDGSRLINTNYSGDVKMIQCTRWEEIQECIQYHILFADAIQSVTNFRFLNHPGNYIGQQQFTVGDKANLVSQEQSTSISAQQAQNMIKRATPNGTTPLTSHIMEIYYMLKKTFASSNTASSLLLKPGQKITIIIATDGLPTNEYGYGGVQYQNEFIDSLRMLNEFQPNIWIIIRLCTDESSVVNFYNNLLDQQYELSVEVLDDFINEAKEVYQYNPWLNYSLILHRLRESGCGFQYCRLLDILDERKFTLAEIYDFCTLLFLGEDDNNNINFDNPVIATTINKAITDPRCDWDDFVQDIKHLLHSEQLQWDPIQKKLRPWIDIKTLNKIYGDKNSCCGCCPVPWKKEKMS